MQARGIALTVTAGTATTGPGHGTLTDPAGNAIQIDRHLRTGCMTDPCGCAPGGAQ